LSHTGITLSEPLPGRAYDACTGQTPGCHIHLTVRVSCGILVRGVALHSI
jgi:hypothetical protein